METTNTTYNLHDSLQRMDDILNSQNICEQKDSIPSRNTLTFTNGYYVNCSAIFVDICGSSDLTNDHTRPVLAKIYRCFISELVALFNGEMRCREISINGDCVWGVFETPNKSDIDAMIDVAAKASSLIDMLKANFKRKVIKLLRLVLVSIMVAH